jgi:hypothetical protein
MSESVLVQFTVDQVSCVLAMVKARHSEIRRRLSSATTAYTAIEKAALEDLADQLKGAQESMERTLGKQVGGDE